MAKLTIKERVKGLKHQARTFAAALAHPDTPWYAKACLGLVLTYLASPIDLIPDFIPILGWMDDLVVLAVGVWVARRLIPESVWIDCQGQSVSIPTSFRILGALVIVMIWAILALAILVWWPLL